MNRKFVAPVIVAGLLVSPGVALGSVKLKISPKSPIVDDSITVSFRTDRALKTGYHYEADVLTNPGVDCASLVQKQSRRRPKKGTTMSFRFSPYDDRLNGGSEWCQGKATVSVSIARNDGKGTGIIIGITEIRFRAKP